MFTEGIIPNINNLFQKTEVEGMLPNSFYETSITLTGKPDEDITRKGSYFPLLTGNGLSRMSVQKSFKIPQIEPWLVWLSGLSVGLKSKGSPV